MIDFSHANSGKDHRKQSAVCRSVSEQIASGDRHIMGVMIESNLVAGSQVLVSGKELVYGQSITDACIDWAETQGLLRELAGAVRGAAEVGWGRPCTTPLMRDEAVYEWAPGLIG